MNAFMYRTLIQLSTRKFASSCKKILLESIHTHMYTEAGAHIVIKFCSSNLVGVKHKTWFQFY